MHCQKLLILLFFSFPFSQTKINITEAASQLYKNQRISQQYLRHDSSINLKEKSRLFLHELIFPLSDL